MAGRDRDKGSTISAGGFLLIFILFYFSSEGFILPSFLLFGRVACLRMYVSGINPIKIERFIKVYYARTYEDVRLGMLN